VQTVKLDGPGLSSMSPARRRKTRRKGLRLGLPDFLQQNTGGFCLSVTFIKDNMVLFHV